MKNKLPLLVAFLLPSLGSPLLSADRESEPYVLVTGQGEVEQIPDQVIINFGVQTNAPVLKQAQDENARRIAALLSALKKSGVPEKNFQTTSVQINPRYDYVNGKQRFVEYVASKNFTVRMDDIEKYGQVFQAALDAGVNQAGGVQFESSKRKELEQEAIKRAVQDAQKKADILAQAAGRKRGEALTIEIGGSEAPTPMFRGKMMSMNAAVEDQVAPGEISIRSSVTIKYRLQ